MKKRFTTNFIYIIMFSREEIQIKKEDFDPSYNHDPFWLFHLSFYLNCTDKLSLIVWSKKSPSSF